jgi:2-dehydropantoate 2-reductase
VPAFSAEEYDDRPDVIFVCVKGYSIDAVLPFLQRVSGPETVIIPILNIFGTGGRLQKDLPGVTVTDGCIYVASSIKSPGIIVQNGEILRVIFGIRSGETCDEQTVEKLKKIEQDLKAKLLEVRK